jgi:hypothetical protein
MVCACLVAGIEKRGINGRRSERREKEVRKE